MNLCDKLPNAFAGFKPIKAFVNILEPYSFTEQVINWQNPFSVKADVSSAATDQVRKLFGGR